MPLHGLTRFFLAVVLALPTHAQTACCSSCVSRLGNEFQRVNSGRAPGPDEWPVFESACLVRFLCNLDYLSCSEGFYDIGCSGMSWGMSTRCQQCPSNTYRDQIFSQRNCFPCTDCTPTEMQTVECTPLNDRRCTCPPNKYYMTKNGLLTKDCGDCTVCKAPSQYLESTCTLTSNTACRDCPTGYKSTADNQRSCSSCVDGYYGGSGSCTPCTPSSAGCFGPTYISCTNGVKSCPYCNGHVGGTSCAPGKGLSAKCTGSLLSNPECENCAAGKERPEGTPMVDDYQQCVKCGVGKYKATVGTANCAACTNKPANSVYKDWGFTQAASTASCPWWVQCGSVFCWVGAWAYLLCFLLVQGLQCRVLQVEFGHILCGLPDRNLSGYDWECYCVQGVLCREPAQLLLPAAGCRGDLARR